MRSDIHHTERFSGKIVLGGTRGSLPLASPESVRFGGATTCMLIDNGGGARIVIDAGSGLRMFQPQLSQPDTAPPVLLLLTHYHLDHLIGLPSFAPLYDPAWSLVIAAPACDGVTAEDAINRFTSPPFWPVRFRARQDYVVLDSTCAAPFRHGPFDVRWCPVHHANGCHAYRIDDRENGASLVFATDLEWHRSDTAERDAFIRLCSEPAPADFLVMDGQYEDDEHTGWGHSRWHDAVEVARLTRAKQLIITHLDPDADDRALEARERRLQTAFPQACLGRQGQQFAWHSQS